MQKPPSASAKGDDLKRIRGALRAGVQPVQVEMRDAMTRPKKKTKEAHKRNIKSPHNPAQLTTQLPIQLPTLLLHSSCTAPCTAPYTAPTQFPTQFPHISLHSSCTAPAQLPTQLPTQLPVHSSCTALARGSMGSTGYLVLLVLLVLLACSSCYTAPFTAPTQDESNNTFLRIPEVSCARYARAL